MVQWQKGLKDHKEVLAFIEKKKIQLPAMIHFRTVSAGTKCAELCHPFPVTEGVQLWTSGYAEQVLFHNGHIHNWEELALNAGLASGDIKFPEGVWSDTRALAWLVWLKGPGILPFIMKGSRIAHFFANATTLGKKGYSREDDHIAMYGSWIEKDGYFQSITTDYSNRGGVVHGGKGNFQRDFAAAYRGNDWELSEEDLWKRDGVPPAPPVKMEPSKPGEGSSTPTSSALLVPGTNEWSLEECKLIIEAIEREQKDAELVAN